MKEFLVSILSKMASGRYLLTVICGIVFAYCSVTKIMPVDATISIVSMVFISYFNRGDRANGKEQVK
jgi:hypothetical protein